MLCFQSEPEVEEEGQEAVGGPTLAKIAPGTPDIVGSVTGMGASPASAMRSISYGYQFPRNHLLAQQGDLGGVRTQGTGRIFKG
jgi:hypothetical protein